MSDDPFADLPDADRTVIRPRPGGRAPAAVPAQAARTAEAVPRGLDDAMPMVGTSPLVQAASPVLAAAIRLRGRPSYPDPAGLRRAMSVAVEEFENRALRTGLDSLSLRAARYALCATIDDIVLSTPWGAASGWSSHSLTSQFHNEVSGGERFYDILDKMERELGRHGDVVELMYLCLSLGFEGRYRVPQPGGGTLPEFRDNVFRRLKARKPDHERELSPHWRGVGAGYNPLRNRIPLWVIGVATLAIALLLYLLFNLLLGSRSDGTFARVSGLPPSGPPAAVRPARQPPPPPAAAPPAPGSTAARLRTFLEPEIRQGLVEVKEDAQAITVRIANRNMFGSGEGTLNSGYLPLLERIGSALQDEPGRVLVVGNTDNQPIRTPRFPSNWQLSTARAETVARIITAKLSDPGRVKVEGRADTDPVAPNTTAEGRQQNRRTDIVVIKPPAAP